MINIESEEYAAFGAEVKKSLSTFMNDRLGCELQWMSNLRQYRGKYDPKVLAKISEERSRAYPRDTRIKVKGGVAKMMEMMFPAKENNWELKVSPVPSIPKSELTRIISELQSAAALAGEEVASDQIEREVKAFAEARKDLMQEEIADQLADKGIDYPNMCKKVIRSGYIYGFGVAKGPMVRTQTEREWVPDGDSFKAVEHQVKRPYPEYVRIWDFYPDFTANSWEAQERCFERFILNRGDLSLLKKRPDFLKTAINSYLVDHPSGNYKAQSFESELNELSNTTNVVDRMKRLYEIYRCVGFFSAHTLQKIGVEVKEEDLGKEVFADVWFLDDIVIKIDLAEAVVGNKPSEFYHAFIYAEDEDSGITGIGLPEEVNDSQMSVGAATRALFDNMASTAGPMYEVNIDLLPPGVKSMGSIHAFKTIERTGEGVAAQYPAVRDLKTTSHIPELLSIISMARQQPTMGPWRLLLRRLP